MNNNKLIIAAAGSGKTTYLINEAIKVKEGKVLITTYTEANADEIKLKFIKKCKCIPSNITVQTWFSFLIQHGVKPYQGTFNELLFTKEVKGMMLNSDGSLGKIQGTHFPYNEEREFEKHYFVGIGKILSDRLSKFVVKSNTATQGELINRISRIYQHIFIDEIQDLAGYDLELLKLLFQAQSRILLVGDPRQVTYLTHHENKYGKFREGRIKEFIISECKKQITCAIDETTLSHSHRNNKAVCDFSSKLYGGNEFNPISPCECNVCRSYEKDFEGIYLVRPKDTEEYLSNFNPIQLRWDSRKEVNPSYHVYNLGESEPTPFVWTEIVYK